LVVALAESPKGRLGWDKETLTYYVQLNAAYLGKYFLPGTFCGAMYDNTINAGVNGKWVEVVKE
jgi:hypothetical protein